MEFLLVYNKSKSNENDFERNKTLNIILLMKILELRGF